MSENYLHIHPDYKSISIFKLINYFDLEIKFNDPENKYAIYHHHLLGNFILFLDKDIEQFRLLSHDGNLLTPEGFLNIASPSINLYNGLFKDLLEGKLSRSGYRFENNPNLIPVTYEEVLASIWKPKLLQHSKGEVITKEARSWSHKYYPALRVKEKNNVVFFLNDYHLSSFFKSNICYQLNDKSPESKHVLTHCLNDVKFARENYWRLYPVHLAVFCNLNNNHSNVPFNQDNEIIIPVSKDPSLDFCDGPRYYHRILSSIAFIVNHSLHIPFSMDLHLDGAAAHIYFSFEDERQFAKFFSTINRTKNRLKMTIYDNNPALKNVDVKLLDHYNYQDGISLSIENRKIFLILGFSQIEILMKALQDIVPPQRFNIQFYS